MTNPRGSDQHDPNQQPEQPTEDTLRDLGGDGGPIGLRTGRDPNNLGDDVATDGDLTYPPARTREGEM